jgi:hypothetical protein
MKGLVIGNCGRICSITKVSRRGDSRTPPCRNSAFKLLFEVGNRLSKDGNSKLGGSKASQFKDCVKSWPTKVLH